MRAPWVVRRGEGPVIAVAVHAGHDLRPEVAAAIALTEDVCFREEDPFTGAWTSHAPTSVVVRRSRFEVDLNRPRDRAVYAGPEDAWGLDVWGGRGLHPATVTASLDLYDAFYALLDELVAGAVARHGVAVVLDCHSYNHRRVGPHADPEPADGNPEVNVGTGWVDAGRWGHVITAFVDALTHAAPDRGPLDVRENVRFRGGHLPRHVSERHGTHALPLALEFKKTWMDEWTGEVDAGHRDALVAALGRALPPLLEAVRAR